MPIDTGVLYLERHRIEVKNKLARGIERWLTNRIKGLKNPNRHLLRLARQPAQKGFAKQFPALQQERER
jgi:hypothetical protein